MIAKLDFGRTGHASTRVIFGEYALSTATQAEADKILEMAALAETFAIEPIFSY